MVFYFYNIQERCSTFIIFKNGVFYFYNIQEWAQGGPGGPTGRALWALWGPRARSGGVFGPYGALGPHLDGRWALCGP